MIRKQNKGVTIVEVIIGVAVFMVLMVPIVTSLVSSIKNTDTAKETQARNEYAEILMENLKEVDIADIKDDTARNAYLQSLGSENTSTCTLNVPGNPDAGFKIKGTTYLGTNKEKYTYVVDFTDIKKSYQHGIVEELDPDRVAIVPASLSNYDNVAEEAMLTNKLSDQQDGKDTEKVFNDASDITTLRKSTANRVIKTVVSNGAISGYDVSCYLRYEDSGKDLEYKLYSRHFSNSKAPNVYVMYNPGVYNETYTTDRFEFDIAGVEERVNVFIVQTANDYSDYVKGQMSTLSADIQNNYNNYVSGGTPLYRTASAGSRDGAINLFNALNGAASQPYLRVYQNVRDIHVENMNGFRQVTTLDLAEEEVWTTYKLKIWMKKGDITDADMADKFVILQGTRGGGEFD